MSSSYSNRPNNYIPSGPPPSRTPAIPSMPIPYPYLPSSTSGLSRTSSNPHPPNLRTHYSEGDRPTNGRSNTTLTRANTTAAEVGTRGWNPSWKSPTPKLIDPIQEAITASRNEGEFDRVRRESEAAEEARAYNMTLSYSREEDELRALRVSEEEAAEEKVLREVIIRSKGKGRETAAERMEREEREEMEMVLQLSLTETRMRREGGGETSAEAFERLSRPSISVEQEDFYPVSHSSNPTSLNYSPSHSPTSPSSPSLQPFPGNLQRRPTSFYVANPDLDPDDTLPPPAYSSTDYQIEENPRNVVLGPERSIHLPPNPPQTSSRIYQRPVIPSSSKIDPTSFYSSHVAAARTVSPLTSPRLAPTSIPDLTRTLPEDETQDPFDETYAAVESTSEDFIDEDEGLNLTIPFQSSYNYSSSSLLPVSPTPSNASRGASPLFGGLVDSSSLNADPDSAVLVGCKFGFMPVSKRHLHPPLDYEGSFPDVAQLSGKTEEFKCFAVEASSWNSLLTYLMWHGNSHLEAAPSDLQLEKSTRGLSCRITLEFFRSFIDASERVRCRIDLVLSDPSSSQPQDPPTSFDPDCPSISIRLPQTPYLPLTLANLATTLSNAHTLSRESNKKSSVAVFSSSTMSNQHRILKNLSLAIDLFRKLKGEEVNADDEDGDEEGLLQKMKLRLKRRRKAPGLVKGGAEGEGVISSSRPLPEGAFMVTPFKLS